MGETRGGVEEAARRPAGSSRIGPAWITPGFLVAIAVAVLLFYRDFVFHADRLLFGTDMLIEGFPLRRFALQEIEAGRGLPLWNPFVYGGLPFLATLPGPIFYPSSLLYLALPLHRAIGWTFVLHTFLATAFGYFAARSFQLGRPAAAVSGTAFGFSGYLMSTLYGGHDGRMFAIVLIPLALGMAERGVRTGKGVWFLGMAAAVALQIFTPHAQMMYFSSLWLLAFCLFRLVYAGGERRNGQASLRRGAWVVGAFALAGLIGAVQVLPAWGLLQHVNRAAQETGYAFASSWAMPPQELTALVLPDLIGSLDSYWGANPFKLHTEYLGSGALALAVVALAGSIGRSTEERGVVWFFAAAAGAGALFALGSATPVHRVAYEIVPLMDSFRAPSMMLGPVACFVALLAGFGWEQVQREDRPFPWGAIWLLSLPFLGLGLAAALAPQGLLDFVFYAWYPGGWPNRPPAKLVGALRAGGMIILLSWLVVAAVAWLRRRGRVGEWVFIPVVLLLAVDLWRVDARYLRSASVEEFFRTEGTIETISERLRSGERVWPLERSYDANELMYHRIPSVSGTQKFLLSWYERLVGGLTQENLLRNPVLWELFDLRYVTLRSPQEVPPLRAIEVGSSEGRRLYEVEADLPHAFFPRRITIARDAADALRRTLALPSGGEEAVVELPEGVEAPPAGAGRAVVEVWHPDEVSLSVEAERAGLLFVSEVWAPGWRARVDRTRTPLYRVNAAFRGVLVPEGRHQIRLAYEPAAVRWGGWLSAAGVAGLLLGLAVPAWRRPAAERKAGGHAG